ncbi:MAG: hypothetical protein CMC21_03830 [Flavobacteriaceae bacterium]|nr:hypothetical protein [Flavobacteriaceae bacterium]|tara:strand:+ start:4026 stop:4856 length:831 start_codon:yes stop_codon:yes gene_type:complete
MKKIITLFSLLLVTVSCQEPDTTINDVLDNYVTGAVLRGWNPTGDYNFFAPSTSIFTVEIEEHDEQNGALMQDVQVYVALNSGTEVLLRTLTTADFAVGPTGLPRHQLTVTLGESIAALGLSSSQYTGGDVINIRLQLNLTDGRSYTAKDAASSLTGSYFKSPYIYNMTIKCIPTGAVAGDYTIDMIDSWGDGWNGASITVTIDGVAQTVGLPSGANGSQTVTVPAGATSMSFAYVSGDWDSEVTYTITFNNGGADQVAISETNPGAGVKVLSVCP